MTSKWAIFLITVAFTITAFPALGLADANEEALQNATVEQLQRMADQLAGSLNAQSPFLENGNTPQLMDRFVAQRIAELAEEAKHFKQDIANTTSDYVRQHSTGINEIRLHERQAIAQNRVLKLKVASQLFAVGWLTFLLNGGFGITMNHPALAVPAMAAGIFLGPVAVFSLARYSYNLPTTMRKERANALKKAAFNVIFSRLAEHGISVPKNNREEWLMGKIDGTMNLPWEKLSQNQKLQYAKQYSQFLQNLGTAIGSNQPEAAREIFAAAAQIDETSEAAKWWRSKTFARIYEAIVESTKKLVALDQEYKFLTDATKFDFLSLHDRTTVDFPDLFTPETLDFVRRSKLQFPAEFQTFAEGLRELGAKINLNIESLPGANGTLNRYAFEITFPEAAESAPIHLNVEITDSSASRASEGRQLSLPAEDPLRFRLRFNEQLLISGFHETYRTVREKLLPETACRHALSSAAKIFLEAAATP